MFSDKKTKSEAESILNKHIEYMKVGHTFHSKEEIKTTIEIKDAVKENVNHLEERIYALLALIIASKPLLTYISEPVYWEVRKKSVDELENNFKNFPIGVELVRHNINELNKFIDSLEESYKHGEKEFKNIIKVNER